MSILRIYFSGHWRDSTSPCPWALCDDNGHVLKKGCDPIAVLPRNGECIAIVAPDRVLSVSAKVPPKSRRRWQESLRFVAEEFTLPDPESNHVVPGPVLPDGRMMLAVVDKPWLKRIIEACNVAKLSVRRMVPETFLPTITPESWTLVWDGNRGFMRTGIASGMVLDNGTSDKAPLALQLSLASGLNNPSATMPAKIEIRFPHQLSDDQRILPVWNVAPVSLMAGEEWDWQRAPISPDTLNLLWGEFAPPARISEWWPHLRPLAILLLAVLAVEILGSNLEWGMLAHEKKTLNQTMERTFHAAFGEGHTLVNAPLQMQRNLAELRHSAGLPDDGDFLSMLDAAAPVFSTLPAGSILGMHYESGQLDVDLKLASATEFNDLRQRLQHKGLGAQAGDIHDAGNGAEARMILQPGGDR
jgi:general secretion pathway protein L